MEGRVMKGHRAGMWAAFALLVLISSCCFALAGDPGGDEELSFKRLKKRPSIAAVTARKGVIGLLRDVDQDGAEELIYVIKEKELEFRIVSLADGSAIAEATLGDGHPAGISAVNLDDDDRLEFIVGYGSGTDALAARFVGGFFLLGVFGIGMAAADSRPLDIDLQHLVALDDDGAILWRRSLSEDPFGDTEWDDPRFRLVIPDAARASAAIILSNDGDSRLIGVSGRDGTRIWQFTVEMDPSTSILSARPGDSAVQVEGKAIVSRWKASVLEPDDQILLAFFRHGTLYVIDPLKGIALLELHLESEIEDVPLSRLLGLAPARGLLILTDNRDQIRMVSIDSGEILWSHEIENIRDVIFLNEDRFMVVWKHGVKILSAAGALLQEYPTPHKVNKFAPVYTDLNGDGSFEFVYTSKKNVVCWNPEQDKVLWTTSLSGFVGGANAIGLYDNFFDLNQDGWLDIPGTKGSGAGRWLSGRTGAVLAKVGAGRGRPIAGDWDQNGKPEFFWWNKCFEVE